MWLEVLRVNFPLFELKSRNMSKLERLGSGKAIRECFEGGSSGFNRGKPRSHYDHILAGPSYANMVAGVGFGSCSSKHDMSSAGKGPAQLPVIKSDGRLRIMGKATNLDWLNRCAVAYIRLSNTEQKISDILMREFRELKNVGILGNKQLLIEFESSNIRDEFIRLRLWDEIFVHIKPWDVGMVCYQRSVWLECSGIPIQSWSLATFNEIAKFWGYLLCVFKDTISFKNCNKAFIFISTNEVVFDSIIDFVLDNQTFEVKVREVPMPGCSDFTAKSLAEETITAIPGNSDTSTSNKAEVGFENAGSGCTKVQKMNNPVMFLEEKSSLVSAMCNGSGSRFPDATDFVMDHTGLAGVFLQEGDAQAEAIISRSEDLQSYMPRSFVAEVEGLFPSPAEDLEDAEKFARGHVGTGNEQDDGALVIRGPEVSSEADQGSYAQNQSFMKELAVCPNSGVIAKGNNVSGSKEGAFVEIADKVGRVSNGIDGDLSVRRKNNFGLDHTMASKGYRIISKANFEALTSALIEGVSEAFELGESEGLNVPSELQSLIKTVMGKRQAISLNVLFENG